MPKSVTFRCSVPQAHTVYNTGTFNRWEADATPMQSSPYSGDGTVTVSLTPGHHEFKFGIDGQWRCESDGERDSESSSIVVLNDFGTKNHVVEVI